MSVTVLTTAIFAILMHYWFPNSQHTCFLVTGISICDQLGSTVKNGLRQLYLYL